MSGTHDDPDFRLFVEVDALCERGGPAAVTQLLIEIGCAHVAQRDRTSHPQIHPHAGSTGRLGMNPHDECASCGFSYARGGKTMYRVIFYDFRDHHDWIGRRPIKPGGVLTKHRKKLPRKQLRDFFTLEAAKQFIADLRHLAGEDEIAATIVDTNTPKPPPKPLDPMLPGDWPLQSRRDGSIF
jgi:hypothetical protein